MGAPRNAGAAAQAAVPAAGDTTTPAPAAVAALAATQTATPADPGAATPAPADPPLGDPAPDPAAAEPEPPKRGTYLSNIELRGMHDNGQPWPAPGEPVELDDDTAAAYLSAGYVIEAPAEPAPADGSTPEPTVTGYRSVRASE